MGIDAGEWCTNSFCYKPSLTAQGTDDYTNFNTSQDRVDARLAWPHSHMLSVSIRASTAKRLILRVVVLGNSSSRRVNLRIRL